MKKQKKMRNPWTPEEDNCLTELYAKSEEFWMNYFAEDEKRRRVADTTSTTGVQKDTGKINEKKQRSPKGLFARIAYVMPGQQRSPKQVRERWTNHLAPGLIKGNWTTDEDQKMLNLYQRLGPKWAEIVKSFSGRTDNQIKNRCNQLSKRIPRKKTFLDTNAPTSADRKQLLLPEERIAYPHPNRSSATKPAIDSELDSFIGTPTAATPRGRALKPASETPLSLDSKDYVFPSPFSTYFQGENKEEVVVLCGDTSPLDYSRLDMVKTPIDTIFDLDSIDDNGCLPDAFRADQHNEDADGKVIFGVPTFETIPTLDSGDIEHDTQDEAIYFCV